MGSPAGAGDRNRRGSARSARSRLHGIRAIVTLLVFAIALPAAAELRPIKRGEPAPYDGAIYDTAGIQLVTKDYRELDKAYELLGNKDRQIEAATSTAEAQMRAIAELKEALDKERIALAFERGRAQGYKDTEAERTETLKTIKEMLAEERASRRWEKLLSIIPIIGAAAVLFTGGLGH